MSDVHPIIQNVKHFHDNRRPLTEHEHTSGIISNREQEARLDLLVAQTFVWSLETSPWPSYGGTIPEMWFQKPGTEEAVGVPIYDYKCRYNLMEHHIYGPKIDPEEFLIACVWEMRAEIDRMLEVRNPNHKAFFYMFSKGHKHIDPMTFEPGWKFTTSFMTARPDFPLVAMPL